MVKVKRERGLSVTIGLQMVLMPQFGEQVLLFAKLGCELGVDYCIFKHCSDKKEATRTSTTKATPAITTPRMAGKSTRRGLSTGEAAVLDGLGNVRGFEISAVSKVGNGSCNLEDAMPGAGREVELGAGLL